MKIAYLHETIVRKNSDDCIVTEYPKLDEAMDFAIVKVSARYPEFNRAVNLECNEIVFVKSGQGKVVVEEKEYLLNAGDIVLIEAGEKFYWDGKMELCISCRPSFKKEQHRYVL